ncbi:MAG: dihydroorotate dehydrogenase electron transfer subunit [Anaerotardibacter sp.]
MHKVLQTKAVITANISLTDRLYLVTLHSEALPVCVLPGNFVHMRIPGMDNHILRRPFSVYHVNEEKKELTILYQVVGFGSQHLTTLSEGTEVDLLGPIGNPWTLPEEGKRALIVAGGVGAAPLYLHTKELIENNYDVTVIMGAQTKEALACLPLYTELLGKEPLIATDDGTYGREGFVTSLVEEEVAKGGYDYCAICGPEPMMRIVSQITLNAGVDTYISLEKRMACGIGACLSCVVPTDEGNKRACIDGPIFNAQKVVW